MACWAWTPTAKCPCRWPPSAAHGGKSPPPAPEPLPAQAAVTTGGEVDYPEMRVMHAATRIDSGLESMAWRGGIHRQPGIPQGKRYLLNPYTLNEAPSESLESVIRRRGSSRRFVPEAISFQAFSTMLYYSAQELSADFLEPGGGLLNDWYVTANVGTRPTGGTCHSIPKSCSARPGP